MTTSIVISIISLCLCISGFFFFRWYIAKKTAASSLLADYRTEVYRLIAEIDAATDRDSLLVEERIKAIKQLLDDTDRRISVYMRELQRSRNGEAMYASLGRGIRAALDSRPANGDAKPAPDLPETPTTTTDPAEASTAANTGSNRSRVTKKRNPKKHRVAPQATPRVAPSEPELGLENAQPAAKPKIKVQIAELSAQGLSPSEIASRLELSTAEVDLALNLLHRA